MLALSVVVMYGGGQGRERSEANAGGTDQSRCRTMRQETYWKNLRTTDRYECGLY